MNHLITLQLLSTLPLVGLIWFIQLVHYPMLRAGTFDRYTQIHGEHSVRTSWVVVPLMLTELIAAILLVMYGAEPLLPLARAGLVLVGLTWASTFFIQVPLHRILARGWNTEAHRRLVRTNWIRTAAWSTRGLLVVFLALAAGGFMGTGSAGDAPALRQQIVQPGPPTLEPVQTPGQPALYAI